jgi:hypothetical protein
MPCQVLIGIYREVFVLISACFLVLIFNRGSCLIVVDPSLLFKYQLTETGGESKNKKRWNAKTKTTD